MTPPELTDLLTAIHATPHRMTLDFAGAGVQALAWLHSVGGSSRTVLEATDRYTPASLIEGVGFTPERFTSRRVALALAKNAHARAQHLIPEPPLFGVGCTATIATDRTKRGEHRCAAAVQDALGAVTYALTLTKGARERTEEETLVSLIILQAVAEACGLLHFPALPLLEGERLEQGYAPHPRTRTAASGRPRVGRPAPRRNPCKRAQPCPILPYFPARSTRYTTVTAPSLRSPGSASVRRSFSSYR